jgi:hypothetical protein
MKLVNPFAELTAIVTVEFSAPLIAVVLKKLKVSTWCVSAGSVGFGKEGVA